MSTLILGKQPTVGHVILELSWPQCLTRLPSNEEKSQPLTLVTHDNDHGRLEIHHVVDYYDDYDD